MNPDAVLARETHRVALWAPPREPVGVAARLELVDGACARAAAVGAGLLIMPEYGLIGGAHEGDSLARAVVCDGPEMQALAAIGRAHGLGLVAGYAEACSGRAYSAAMVIDAQGHAIGNYRRVHVGARHDAGPAPGQWLTIVPSTVGRLGLVIGADLRFPETSRGLVLSGADLLVVLGARDDTAVIAPLITARALENHVAVLHAGYPDQDAAASMAAMADGRSAEARTMGDLTVVAVPADRTAERERRSALLSGRRPRLYQRVALD